MSDSLKSGRRSQVGRGWSGRPPVCRSGMTDHTAYDERRPVPGSSLECREGTLSYGPLPAASPGVSQRRSR
jgi:hypothetical protein